MQDDINRYVFGSDVNIVQDIVEERELSLKIKLSIYQMICTVYLI